MVAIVRECHFGIVREAGWEVSTGLKMDGKLLTS